jgi:hypothetical protein
MITLMLALTGCSDGLGGDDILLENANNYIFTSTLAIGTVEIQEKADITVDWCGLTVDFLELAMAPEDVDYVVLSRWELSKEELEATLVATNLPQKDLSGSADYSPEAGECSAPLSEFEFLGTPILVEDEIYASDSETYILTVFADDRAKMLTFFEPVAAGSTDPIVIDNNSGSVSFDVVVDAGTAVASTGTPLVDWSSLTQDGAGQEFPLNKMDRMYIARYDLTADELAADFKNLETLATEEYTVSSDALLDYDLSTIDGFGGFTDSGLWVLAMRCTTCYNPAPPFLTLVEAE